jgi:hypothetical protein
MNRLISDLDSAYLRYPHPSVPAASQLQATLCTSGLPAQQPWPAGLKSGKLAGEIWKRRISGVTSYAYKGPRPAFAYLRLSTLSQEHEVEMLKQAVQIGRFPSQRLRRVRHLGEVSFASHPVECGPDKAPTSRMPAWHCSYLCPA